MHDDDDPWKPVAPAEPPVKQSKLKAADAEVPWGLILGISIPVFLLTTVGLFVALTWDSWSFGGQTTPPLQVEVDEEDLSEQLAAVERDAQAASSAFAAAFADLAGDPLIIRFAEGAQSRAVREVPRPPDLSDVARIPQTLVLVSDVMVSAEERFLTTLPSTQEDFAFFKAQKAGSDEAANAIDAVLTNQGSAPTDPDLAQEDGGWGDTVDGTDQDLEFSKTRIEDNTSVAFVRGEQRRDDLTTDIFVRISARQSVQTLLVSKNFQKEDAEAVQAKAAELWGLEELTEGLVVALRGIPGPGGALSLVQMSVYRSDAFIGTMAIDPAGRLTGGADPWLDQELFDYTGEADASQSQEQRFRLLDAFYSAAIRNKVPATLVGEAIALLSKSNDLNAFANPGDRMMVVYGSERLEEDTGAGQILYIALRGKEIDIECFVFRASDGGYNCFGATPQSGGSAVSGMVTPVQGVLTSRFGPRNHPILKTVRLHAGVDWAAPIGTPVAAAFDGTITYAGTAGGYGNLIKISHSGGFETRYAHLNAFAAKQGDRVRAGDVVGQVGTTGRSTGPHLHFELHLNGKAIDPLATAVANVAPSSTQSSGAVEQLVNQIIQVESAGNKDAKNPLSTATGLGQFIESTWLRMMRTYRPDLVASLSRADLLNLRRDPTISREMVKNLALEGESYLRARGHSITAGRLYLCHFLGAEGAHVVLSSQDGQTLLDVLGAGVINANPFLRGKNVAYIKSWAERKMAGRGRAVAALPATNVVREPAGLKDYREAIKTLLTGG